ncbi:MAG: tRNA (5-methylaminomethyl-2-thiouridylate)-methyltransferase, partial [Proteobacteria bacterium]|nr:tRNA (5-methylaminomethyl-2-thiouridylate)-methyltransferase [Pseudomonadota bacterium]
SHAGPLALIEGEKLDQQQIELACAITARYSKGRDSDSVELLFSDQNQSTQQVHIKPLAANEIQQEWYIA